MKGTGSDLNNDIFVNAYWKKVDSFSTIISEAVFTNFAKLGSAIINGDFMFSQHGYINNQYYGTGAIYNTGTEYVPAYTMFYPGISISQDNSAIIYEGNNIIQINHSNGYDSVIDTGIEIYIGNSSISCNVEITS